MPLVFCVVSLVASVSVVGEVVTSVVVVSSVDSVTPGWIAQDARRVAESTAVITFLIFAFMR